MQRRRLLTSPTPRADHDITFRRKGARIMTETVKGSLTEGADGAIPDRAGRGAADLDAAAAVSDQAGAADLHDPQLIEDIEEALRDVVDPELGINIVDLGLVYDLHVDTEKVATIDMTLTSAACPLTDMIEE